MAFSPQPKPESRKTAKMREERANRRSVSAVRGYCFARERHICRCCRARLADSLHELVPRSLGGKVSRKNSIALCGSGTTGCHGLIQAHRITVVITNRVAWAEDSLVFVPQDAQAVDWLKLKGVQSIESPPMVAMEAAE